MCSSNNDGAKAVYLKQHRWGSCSSAKASLEIASEKLAAGDPNEIITAVHFVVQCMEALEKR